MKAPIRQTDRHVEAVLAARRFTPDVRQAYSDLLLTHADALSDRLGWVDAETEPAGANQRMRPQSHKGDSHAVRKEASA